MEDATEQPTQKFVKYKTPPFIKHEHPPFVIHFKSANGTPYKIGDKKEWNGVTFHCVMSNIASSKNGIPTPYTCAVPVNGC